MNNLWLVFIALVLTVREKEHIALNVIYSRLPTILGFLIQQFWTLIILSFGILISITGTEVIANMGGRYWEMWYFSWENGSLAFKPIYMPKRYAMYILPLMGSMISVSAFAAILEDVLSLRKGQFKINTLGSE